MFKCESKRRNEMVKYKLNEPNNRKLKLRLCKLKENKKTNKSNNFDSYAKLFIFLSVFWQLTFNGRCLYDFYLFCICEICSTIELRCEAHLEIPSIHSCWYIDHIEWNVFSTYPIDEMHSFTMTIAERKRKMKSFSTSNKVIRKSSFCY